MRNGIDHTVRKVTRKQTVRTFLPNVHALPPCTSPVGVLECINCGHLTVNLGQVRFGDEFDLPPIVFVDVDRFRVIVAWVLDCFWCHVANRRQGEKYRVRVDLSDSLRLGMEFPATPGPCEAEKNSNGTSDQKPNTDLGHFALQFESIVYAKSDATRVAAGRRKPIRTNFRGS